MKNNKISILVKKFLVSIGRVILYCDIRNFIAVCILTEILNLTNTICLERGYEFDGNFKEKYFKIMIMIYAIVRIIKGIKIFYLQLNIYVQVFIFVGHILMAYLLINKSKKYENWYLKIRNVLKIG